MSFLEPLAKFAALHEKKSQIPANLHLHEISSFHIILIINDLGQISIGVYRA